MGSLDNLYRLLEPTGLYTLRQNSLVDRELAAYQAAFDVAERLLEEIRREAFPQTAGGEGLSRHERLVGLQQRQNLPDETRRELVLYRLGAAPFDFHLEGMMNSIRAAGMEAELVEHPGQERLTIRSRELIDEFLDLDSVKASVNTVLPAHLEIEYDIGFLTWDMMDDTEIHWDRWDGLDFTWTEFDISGHEIITREE